MRMMTRYGSQAILMMASDTGGAGLDESAEFSLADLADLDVSEIDEVRFETTPIGTYEWEVAEADLIEDVDRDGAKRFRGEFKIKVVEALAVMEPGIDKESLVGKIQNEMFFIFPGKPQADVLKAIGRLRAFITDIGCDSSGSLGAAVKNTIGHRFKSKLTHRKDRDDPTIVYSRIKLETGKRK